MLFFSANPETLDAWKAHYRHKLALLLVIYLVLPVAKDDIASAQSAISSTVLPTAQQLPLQHSAITEAQQAVTLDAAAASPSPLTPRYEHGSASSSPEHQQAKAREEEEVRTRNAMPVKGSTTRDSNSSSSWSATPPISPPPPRPQQSGGVATTEEDAVKHKDQQEEQFGEQSASQPPSSEFSRQSRPSPLTLPAEANSELADALEELSLFLLSTLHNLFTTLLEWRPSPFHLFAFLMHLLCLVQLVALLVEDSIVRTTMADPLPKELPRGSTWGKRLSRWSWRGRQLTSRYKGAMGSLAVCAVVCAWVGWEAVMMHAVQNAPGWNDVPAARWVRGMVQEMIEGEVRRCPFRLVVVIETLAAILSLVQPLKHLLPTSILPPTLPPPALLFPSSKPASRSPTPRVLSPSVTPNHSTATSPASSSPPSPSRIGPGNGAYFTFPPSPPPLALETHWLLLHLDSLLQSFLSLFQFALLLPLLPRSTYSLFHPAPHILLLSIRGRLIAIGKTRDKMRRTVECLRVVFDEFPEGVEGVGGGKEREEEAEEDWVCTICFEGMEEEEGGAGAVGGSGLSSPAPSGSNSPTLLGGEATASRAKRTMKARCRLPCSHRYHAGCLTTWLQYQSWCPSCHAAITSKRSDVAAPSTTLAPLFPQQPAEVDRSDIYPGNRPGARRRTFSDD